jgi:hypothetical protein
MPDGQLPSEPRPRAPPNAGPNFRKCSRETLCPFLKNAPGKRRSATRYGLGSILAGTQGRGAPGGKAAPWQPQRINAWARLVT